MSIEIYPKEKVVLDGVSLCFGANAAEVEAAIGKGEIIRNRHYYFDNELAIDYDKDQRLEFIEFLGGIDGHLRPKIYGVSVFETSADELTEILSDKNGEPPTDDENGHMYCFLNISVGIYRERTSADIEEMIAEMKADGVPTENNADLESEKRMAQHWATLGTGREGYYLR